MIFFPIIKFGMVGDACHYDDFDILPRNQAQEPLTPIFTTPQSHEACDWSKKPISATEGRSSEAFMRYGSPFSGGDDMKDGLMIRNGVD
ncbi:hypothetical protein N7504_005543 [Penicillium tannophilum]|nr:hypothetical protein N7504_005543 [Penicillium tannophilum]